MFKKIFEFLFGPVEYQVDSTGLQYGPKEELVKEPVVEEFKSTIANATVSINAELSKNFTEVRRLPIVLPESSILHKHSASSPRIYIYNISPLSHEKDHPIFKKVTIPGCPVGQPYKLAFSLPSILPQTRVFMFQNDEISFEYINGARVAMDIVNPDNLGLDQSVSVVYSCSQGNDLGVRGVFWSYNNPPTEEELESVKKRFRKHCRNLLEQAGAKVYTMKNPFQQEVSALIKKGYTEEAAIQEVQRKVQIGPEHHAAADYLRVRTVWHPVLEKKVKP